MNELTKEELKIIEKRLAERLFSDIQYSLEQFNKQSIYYLGWEKQNEIKRECLTSFLGFYK